MKAFGKKVYAAWTLSHAIVVLYRHYKVSFVAPGIFAWILQKVFRSLLTINIF